jgi:hypothetical protein
MHEGKEPKKKRRGLRRLLVYGGMVLATCVGLSVLVRLPLFNAWLSNFLEGQLEASLGEQVELEGVEISLLPLALQARSLKVMHNGEPIIEVDGLRVDFDFYGLGGINTLHLERPRARFHVENGKLVELPGLSWGAETVERLPWDTLSIHQGDVEIEFSNGAVKLVDVDLVPTGHGVGDASIGKLSFRRDGWHQEAENIRLRGLRLSKEILGADSILLETELGRVEGGIAVQGPQHAWTGRLKLVVNLEELDGLLPEHMALEGKLEADLKLGGTGEDFEAKGPMKSTVLLLREEFRTHRSEISSLEGQLVLRKNGFSLREATTPWYGGELILKVEADYTGGDVKLWIAGNGVSVEEVLRSEGGFPHPWVGMQVDFSTDLAGSIVPLDLQGDMRLRGMDLVVINEGLHSGSVPTFAMSEGELSGSLEVDAKGTRIKANDVHFPNSQGTAEVFLGRGEFPALDVNLDLGQLDFAQLKHLGEIELGGQGSLKGRIWGNLGRGLHAEGVAKADRFRALGLEWADHLETRISSPDLKVINFQPLLARKGQSLLQGSLVLDFQPTGLQMAVDLLVAEARLEDLLSIVLPTEGLSGSIEGTISLSGPPGALSGDIDLELAMVDLFGESFTDGRIQARVDAGRIVLDPLRLSREEARESLWFRGAIDSRDWSLKGELNADRLSLQSARVGNWIAGEVYADIGLTGSLMSPIPKGKIALREGRLMGEPVGISVFHFERVGDELIWTGDLFEEALSIRARQELGGLWKYSLEGGWRGFPVHAAHPVAADGRAIRATLDGGFVFQGNWREGRPSIHGRAIAERFEVNWGEYSLRNEDPWILDVIGGDGVASELGLIGSGMAFSGGLQWNASGMQAQGNGIALLGILPALAPGIEIAEGPVELSLRVDTSKGAPHVRLEAVTTLASLRTKWFPHSLEGFTARLVATEQGYALSGLGGSLGGGRFSADGHIHAENWWPTRYDLQGQLSNGRIRYLRFLPTLEGDARLSLEGPVDSLMLSGDIQLEDVRFSERIDWEQWIIDVRESKLAPEVQRADKDPLFSMNLRIKGQGAARIRNNLAHGEADVDLQVLGDTERPGLLGTVRMLPGGRMFIQDREFEVDRAELHYVDPWSFDPELDILLNTEIRSRDELYRIDYQVGGPFSNWYTQASSQPALSQADINALLLFGLTREELERFGGVNSALLLEGADILLHGVGLDTRALERLGGGSLPFDRVELVTGVSERGNQVNSETRILVEKTISDPYNVDVRLEFNPFRNAENYLELEKQVGESFYLTLYRTSLEQERSIDIGGAYGLDFKVRWEVE